jgi:hypothetical protein
LRSAVTKASNGFSHSRHWNSNSGIRQWYVKILYHCLATGGTS